MSMKPGDAKKDRVQEELDKLIKEAELANLRVGMRAEMRSAGEEEISSVIDQRLLETQLRRASQPDSGTPAQVKGLARVLELLPMWGRVAVVLALIAAFVYLTARGVGLKL